MNYQLDPVGNRLNESSSIQGLTSGNWSFNADDELANETYDLNGNVTSTGGKTFSYDSQNQLISMNGGQVQLVYDAFGNRVSKTVGGVTTTYLVEDDVNPTGYPQVFDELTNGVVSRTYAYGLQRISQDQIVKGSWTVSYYGYDGGGSVRNLTNTAGIVTDTYVYDAFGNALKTSGSTPNAYLYRGEQYDADLGLYYLRARYYNPTTGRFMSRDPEDGIDTDPGVLHKYLYGSGNPVNMVDPFGRTPENVGVAGSQKGICGGGIADYVCIALLVTPATLATMKVNNQVVACEFEKAASEVWVGVESLAHLMMPSQISQSSCWVEAKFDHCDELNDNLQSLKDLIRNSGGSCQEGLPPSVNVYRLALWTEEVEMRLQIKTECFAGEYNAGHENALKQAEMNVAKCIMILGGQKL